MLSQHHTTTLLRWTRTLPLNLFSWSAAASLGMLATFSFDAPAFGQERHLCDHTPENRLAVINQRRGIIVRGDRDFNGNLILTPDRLLEPKHYCNDVIIVSNQSLRLKDQDPSDVRKRTGSYTVVLGAQPGADVFVNVHTTNSDVSVSPNLLTFTRANWNQPQTVNVTSYIGITGRVISHSVESDGSPYYRWLGNNLYSPLPLYVDITGYREQEPEDEQEQEPTPEDEPTPEPEQEPEPLEGLDNTIKDILEGEGSSEEKLERVKEATSNWSKEQKQEALSEAKKEVLIGAAKVFAEELLGVGGVKGKIAKAVVKKGLEKAAKYSPKVAELIKKGESVKRTIDKINEIKDTVDDIKNIKEGVDVIIEETSSNNGNNSSNNNINKTINNIAEALYLNHNLLQGGYISLDQAFSGQDFSVPFNLSQVFSQDQESSPRFNALLSADIGFSRFSDSSDSDFYIDGTTTNYGIGLTVIPNPEVPLITGLQFGYTQSNSDFESTDLEGTYNLRMFSVHPFIGWDATDSLTVWSVIGYGRPNDETTINSVYSVEIPTEEVSYSSSGDFFSFAGGANYRVWQSDLSALSIGLSGSTTSLLDNDSQQGSISAQFSHKFPFDTGQLQTSADLALILSDSGPSATELSGNLNWLPNQGRLSGSTNARVLLFGGDRSEWGIGGSVTLLPGQQGKGLSLALRPSFGRTASRLDQLLDSTSFLDGDDLAFSTTQPTAQLRAEAAYGFLAGNNALLTPYTKASFSTHNNTYAAGLRYQLDSGLNLDLSASHKQRSNGNNDNRFFLQLRSDL